MRTRPDDGVQLDEFKEPLVRYHYLEWILSICLVMWTWSRVEKMSINDVLGFEIAVDNRNYKAAFGSHSEGISPLEVRFISVARQWNHPLLFWAWGSWLARSKPALPPLVSRLLACAAIAIVMNSGLWLLGPQDPDCDPSSKCPSATSVFSFTVVPHSGRVYPYFFQASVPLLFLAFIGLSWPLTSMLGKGSVNPGQVVLQWLLPALIYTFVTLVWRDRFPFMPLLLLELLFYEMVFLAVASLTLSKELTKWLPVRALHYLMAVVTTCQFACTPVSPAVEEYSVGCALFIFVGTFKLFQLGYVMGSSRTVERLFSQLWPLVLLVYIVVAPSTNWYRAGDVVFPYFPRMLDRTLYVSGTVCLAFCLDRMGQLVETPPLPAWVSTPVLLAFLAFPLIITLLLAAGANFSAYTDFYITAAIAGGMGAPLGMMLEKRRKGWKEVDESSDSSE